MKQLVVLDRDGVINADSDEYIKSPDEWHAIPGSIRAISRLTNAGYHIAVVTNQSGLARGFFDIGALNDIHRKMYQEVRKLGGRIDAVLFCPHGPDDDCACRKPKPGMLRELSERLRSDLIDVPMIGDSLRDLQAAQAVGGRPILVRTGKGAMTEESGEGLKNIEIFDDLASVVNELLAAP
ncbi:MAG: D-glycero-beta-D-manno-heptose 1,7-bisphosphate 7-phosphatase [Gammaproteobacteria bacterium]